MKNCTAALTVGLSAIFFIHLARRKGHSYTAKHNYYINCSVCDIFDKIMEKITYLPVEVTWILYEGNIVTSININFGHKNGLQTAINFVQFLWQPRSEPSIINQLSTHSVLWMNKLKKTGWLETQEHPSIQFVYII